MKNEKKKAAENKMSLAARKAWETRRKKSGIEKKEKSEVEDEPEIIVEQFKQGHRHKGVLKYKPRRSQVRKSSVKLTGKNADKEFMEFLYGRNYEEEALVNKLCDLCWRRRWCMAGERVRAKARLQEPVNVPSVLVVQ